MRLPILSTATAILYHFHTLPNVAQGSVFINLTFLLIHWKFWSTHRNAISYKYFTNLFNNYLTNVSRKNYHRLIDRDSNLNYIFILLKYLHVRTKFVTMKIVVQYINIS